MSTPTPTGRIFQADGEHFSYLCYVADPAKLVAFAKEVWAQCSAASPLITCVELLGDSFADFHVPEDFDAAFELEEFDWSQGDWMPSEGKALSAPAHKDDYVYMAILNVTDDSCWFNARRKHDNVGDGVETACFHYRNFEEAPRG